MKIFEEFGGSGEDYLYELAEHSSERYKKSEERALEEIKQLHLKTQRYVYSEESAASVLKRCCVSSRDVEAEYSKTAEKKNLIKHDGRLMHVEEFAENFYQKIGYSVQRLESTPLHALFGIFAWMLIQDPADPLGRVVQFGSRTAYERDCSKEPIATILPEDFGTPGYAERRTLTIDQHIRHLEECSEDLEWLFDYWVQPSEGLRQYLWAHREKDVEVARRLVTLLSPATIINIVHYLLCSYWARYLGWPDLLVTREDEALFVEVKSSKDRLSEDQKNWVVGNYENLKLPFEIFKVHRANRPTERCS